MAEANLKSLASMILRDIDKRAYGGKFLGLPQIQKSLVGLDKCEIRGRNDFDPTYTTTTGWSRPKDQQNKTDKFLSVFGIMYVIVNSKKDKGKALKQHILKDIVPRGFNAKIEEIQEKHRQTIEEKDAAIALLNDGLRNRKYENMALQVQRDVYMIIEKNTTPKEDEFNEYPYYTARIQQRFITTKRRWFKEQYPHHRFIIGELANVNSIHAFNRFEEKGYVERFQCHFRFVDIPRYVFYALATPTIQE